MGIHLMPAGGMLLQDLINRVVRESRSAVQAAEAEAAKARCELAEMRQVADALAGECGHDCAALLQRAQCAETSLAAARDCADGAARLAASQRGDIYALRKRLSKAEAMAKKQSRWREQMERAVAKVEDDNADLRKQLRTAKRLALTPGQRFVNLLTGWRS